MNDEVVRVERDAGARQYEVFVGDRKAGLAGYRDEDGRRVLTHTEVDPEFGGRGLAAHLARRAFEDARAEGRRVVPRCSYMAKYAERHPEYSDLVEQREARRRRTSEAASGATSERSEDDP